MSTKNPSAEQKLTLSKTTLKTLTLRTGVKTGGGSNAKACTVSLTCTSCPHHTQF